MTSNPQLSKLKFRILDCTSSDPDFPAIELITQSEDSRGWQSERFCDFPQEIVIQFFSPVRLRQIQLLGHLYKIPSKVEIYACLPNYMVPEAGYGENQYRSVGYLKFDTNEKTHFQARELKSIYVDQPCLYLKFVFQRNYNNKFNIFNQVGLMAVSFFGDVLRAKPKLPETNNKKIFVFENEAPEEPGFDAKTLDRLKTLEAQKERAVRNEDFDEAKKIKECIIRLKEVARQLAKIEENKLIAITNEDFDTAKLLKAEAERLRNTVAPESIFWKNAGIQEPNEGEKEKEAGPVKNNEESMKNIKLVEDQAPKEEVQDKEKSEAKESINEERKVSKTERVQKQFEIDENQEKSAEKQNLDSVENANDDGKIHGEQAASTKIPKGYEFLCTVLGEESCAKLFSSKWQERDEELVLLEKQAKEGKGGEDKASLFLAYMGAASYGLGDNVNHVNQSGFQLLWTILEKDFGKLQGRSELNQMSEFIFQALLEKITKNRERCEKSFLLLCKNSQITPHPVVHFLTDVHSNPKLISSHKHITMRFNVLGAIMKSFKVTSNEQMLFSITDFALKFVDHSNQEVRLASITVLKEVYEQIGEKKFSPFLEKMKPAQQDVLYRDLGILMDKKKEAKEKESTEAASKSKKRTKLTIDDIVKENQGKIVKR